MPASSTLVLLFTTFPVATETFLQREVKALAAEGVDLELWSLWKGKAKFGNLPVNRPSVAGWFSVLGSVPYWALRHPRRFLRILRPFLSRRPPNRLNLGENLLGLALGLRFARVFEKRRDPFVLHAVWASLPATFAWTLFTLTGKGFSFAAHAYDLFEDGGDWLLPEKCRDAFWIRTSARVGESRLRELGAAGEKIAMIRRGLLEWPPTRDPAERRPEAILRIVSVGRLVEKMGHALQLQAYAELHAQDIAFEAEWIGDGPLRATLNEQIVEFGLENHVRLRGARPFSEVRRVLSQSNLALFTGVVAANGDQAGFPNFIGEAMAWGVPVVATRVGAVEEVITDGVNGLIATNRAEIVAAVKSIRDNPAAARVRASRAREWIEENFDARANMRRFRIELGV